MNQDGIDLLKEFEGWSGVAYIPVPGDVPTIGYGFTKGVRMGDTMTKRQGEARLKKEIVTYEDQVAKACTVTPNENQLAGMTCLAYNIGVPTFQKSTVLRAHNAGNEQAAARAFGLFNKSGGKVYAGLTRRRAAEAALYLKPEPEKQQDHPMPQTIDAETTLAKSPLSLMGGLTSAGGVLGTVSAVGDQVGDVASKAGSVGAAVTNSKSWIAKITETVGVSPLVLCCIALVVIGGVVMFYRWRQRRAGWA